MVIVGAGIGTVMVTSILAAQGSVSRIQMGVATSTINFTRQIGGAIGVAISGAVMINGLTSRLHGIPAAQILSPGAAASVSPGQAGTIRLAFAGALHQTFMTGLIFGTLAVLTTFLVPKGKATTIRDLAQAGDLPAEPAAAAAAHV